MAFVDPVTIHNPSSGTAPPATWGDQLRDNDVFLYERGPYICTSGTRPGAPAEGYVIYETDTDRYYSWSGAAWVLFGDLGVFGTYVPTLTQSGTVTKTDTYVTYTRTGRLVTGWFFLTVTGSGTANNLITLSAPVTSGTSTTDVPVGTGYVFDNSTTLYYPCTLVMDTSTTFKFLATHEFTTGFAGVNSGGSSLAFALASPDIVAGQFTYPAAASA